MKNMFSCFQLCSKRRKVNGLTCLENIFYKFTSNWHLHCFVRDHSLFLFRGHSHRVSPLLLKQNPNYCQMSSKHLQLIATMVAPAIAQAKIRLQITSNNILLTKLQSLQHALPGRCCPGPVLSLLSRQSSEWYCQSAAPTQPPLNLMWPARCTVGYCA